MIFNPSERQQAALSILTDVVQRWYAEGRRAYGASLKPEMRALTSGEFDEKQLGFMTFKRFLLAAADQGLVDVHPAPNSPDVQVVPKGKPPVAQAERRAVLPASSVPRVREDLWKAFVDWNTAFERFYDRDKDVAHRIAATESAYDSPQLRTLRQEKEAQPDRFVPISPITFAEQVDWMRQFVAKQSPEVQLGLLPAVDSPRPARDFSMTVRRSPQIALDWHTEKTERVVERIDAWKAEHGVTVDIYAMPAGPTEHLSRDRRVSLALDENRLRERIHAAIDAMSVAELLDLPIRLHHIVEVDR